jgi:hypothetical protein
MQLKQIKVAAFAVFDEADESDVGFAARLMELGIGDWPTARPLALEWAAKKYNDEVVKSNRPGAKAGDMTLAGGSSSAAYRRLMRLRDVIFGGADTKPKEKAGNTDPVESLRKYVEKQLKGMTPYQRRKAREILAGL